MTGLNFNNIQKRYFTVTLNDEKNTTIMIGTPTKAVTDILVDLHKRLTDPDLTDEMQLQTIDDMYDLGSKIMSRNKGGVKISKKFLENTLDIDDMTLFFGSYFEFIGSLANEKN